MVRQWQLKRQREEEAARGSLHTRLQRGQGDSSRDHEGAGIRRGGDGGGRRLD